MTKAHRPTPQARSWNVMPQTAADQGLCTESYWASPLCQHDRQIFRAVIEARQQEMRKSKFGRVDAPAYGPEEG